MDLRVLYVGQPDTARERTFLAFLAKHFTEVRSAPVTDIGQLVLDGVDVVLVDGEPLKGVQPPRELSADALPLPTVLMGGIGGKVSDAIGLKLGWQFGCLCLDHRALFEPAAVQHPIFGGPHAVPRPAPQTIPAPENFLLYRATKQVSDTVDVVAILNRHPLGTEQEQADQHERMTRAMAAGDQEALRALMADQPSWGLVSTSAGFFDSPDCERILGGINQKANDYVAVGRQGRFLAWGFHGEPETMTDLGKALFLNAIHYIAGFAGAPVEALRVQESRDLLKVSLGFLDHSDAGDPAQRLAGAFGGTVPDGIGLTTEEALAWYAENRGYLRRIGTFSSGHYEVDQDLVQVGIGNDDPRLLEVLAPLLGASGGEGERARRLWQRYVRRDSSDAAQEQAWLNEHREALFFSDWAGYRWIARDDLPRLVVPRSGRTESGPVTVTVHAQRDGNDVDVTISFSIQSGFHLYAPGATDGIPVTIEPRSDHEVVSGPLYPDAQHLAGHVDVPLRLRGTAEEIELAVQVQACDEQSCTQPTTLLVRSIALA
jgi:hypothetical protein